MTSPALAPDAPLPSDTEIKISAYDRTNTYRLSALMNYPLTSKKQTPEAFPSVQAET